MRHLDRVGQDVLCAQLIRCCAPQQADDLRVQAMTQVSTAHSRLSACAPPPRSVPSRPSPRYGPDGSGRRRHQVGHASRRSRADRVERRHHHGYGGVVDDDVHPGQRFKVRRMLRPSRPMVCPSDHPTAGHHGNRGFEVARRHTIEIARLVDAARAAVPSSPAVAVSRIRRAASWHFVLHRPQHRRAPLPLSSPATRSRLARCRATRFFGLTPEAGPPRYPARPGRCSRCSAPATAFNVSSFCAGRRLSLPMSARFSRFSVSISALEAVPVLCATSASLRRASMSFSACSFCLKRSSRRRSISCWRGCTRALYKDQRTSPMREMIAGHQDGQTNVLSKPSSDG